MLKFDELNILSGAKDLKEKLNQSQMGVEEIEDTILDILIMSYAFGNEEANEILGGGINPSYSEMKSAIYKKFDGKDFTDRVKEYVNDVEAMAKVIDTDSHRCYEAGLFDTAKASGKKVKKTWVTMGDELVRDSHSYLEGQTVDLDQDFYTYDGKHAPYPSGFNDPSEDCNCRCSIAISL